MRLLNKNRIWLYVYKTFVMSSDLLVLCHSIKCMMQEKYDVICKLKNHAYIAYFPYNANDSFVRSHIWQTTLLAVGTLHLVARMYHYKTPKLLVCDQVKTGL